MQHSQWHSDLTKVLDDLVKSNLILFRSLRDERNSEHNRDLPNLHRYFNQHLKNVWVGDNPKRSHKVIDGLMG
jgi:hypothetical protein